MRIYTLFGSLFMLALFSYPSVSQAACQASNVTIDGVYTDWAECPVLVTDKSDTAINTNLQYWDRTLNQWVATDPGYTTWTFDDAAMLDVQTFKMLNDEQYIYFYMKNSWPMMAVKAPDGVFYGPWEFGMLQFGGSALTNYEFYPTGLPDFDHWMVWSFDNNLDGIYDYYFAAHIDSDLMLSQTSGEKGGPALGIYQDTDGDGVFNVAVDNKLADVEEDGTTSMDATQNASSYEMEIRQTISQLYELTGMTYGDTVRVRMETHSTIGDTTKGKRYTFDIGSPTGLTATVSSTNNEATLSWDENALAEHYIVVVYTKKGKKKFSKLTTAAITTLVSGLNSDTTYKFRVRAVTGNGFKGKWSAYKKFTTN